MGGKHKSIIPGVTILQFVENIPEGCNAPNILRKPLPLTKPEGKETLKTENFSFSFSYLTWRKNQIKKLTISDAGYYKCTASNEYGEAFCTVNLIVAQGILDCSIPHSSEATEKKEEFSEEYVWEILMEADKKDYEKICHKYGITNYRYMLKQLNQMKKEREEKQAEVNHVSVRVETKKDGSCTFGFEMDLKNPASKIFLYKNGEMISYDTEEMMRHYLKQVGKKYTFCIKDLQPDDVGMYRVDVEDATVFSTAIEESAIPVGFTYQLSDVKCEESEDAVFECASSVPLVANWTFGSQSLADGDKYQIEVSPDSLMHSLTVKDISPADSGLYTISAGELSSSARLILEGDNLSGKSSKHGQRRGLHGSDLDGLNKLKSSQDGTNNSARHFKTGLSNVSVRKGQDTELCCVLASEMSDGCWYKNGKKVSLNIYPSDKSEMVKDGTKHTLKLHNVQEEDSGIYRFESDGRKTEASLLIEEPPELDQDVLNQLRKKPITVKAGHTATVKVPFSGKPPVKATWSKDGDELLDDRRISISNDGKFTRLSISNCSRKDRGKLSVKLRNESGTTETFVADLLVTDKPLSPQGPVEVVESSEHCIAIKWKPVRDDGGVPLSHYTVERQQVGRNTWNKVGDVDKDTTTISTDKVEPQKKYMFRIWAVNPEGVSESLVSDAVAAGIKGKSLRVLTPPKIVTSSSKAIKLSWAAPRSSGGLRLTGYFIEKRKKGSNIWNTINEEPIPDLQWIVTDVVAGQEYEFRVIAVNSSGRGEPSGESESVFAREPMDPPGIVKDLRVTYSDYSSISLAWTPPLRQNNDFAEGYLVEVKSFGSTTWTRCNTAAVNMTSYTVKGLKEMGKYSLRVTAVNSGGMGTPLELDRYVFAMPPAVCPKFVLNKSINKFMVIEEGNSIRTQFSFEGSPPPEVTWLKDGLPLSKEATIINTTENSQLFIPASQRSDSGIYSIFLKNFFGQESFDFEIRVTAIPKPPGPLTLDENVPNTVTVSWESSWDEHLDDHLYYVVKKRDSSRTAWHTVGNNIFNNRFTIINIIPERKYYFRVLAKNDMAFSDPSDTKEPWSISKKRDPFTLKLPTYKEVNKNRVPVFSVKLKTHIVPSGCDVNMSCAVEGYPLPQVTWYKNNIALENNRNYWSTNVCGVCSLCIFGASPNDSGLYTAIAENSLGRAMCSTTLTITAIEPVPRVC
uniref:Immunoglobulin like and fibronectin type III domain containing 1, tandem duplicate 3 n=1 Tax=Callorhinchus milii TaxID=7868 RepID=A0A4W3GFB3_CALMI